MIFVLRKNGSDCTPDDLTRLVREDTEDRERERIQRIEREETERRQKKETEEGGRERRQHKTCLFLFVLLEGTFLFLPFLLRRITAERNNYLCLFPLFSLCIFLFILVMSCLAEQR